MQVARNQQTDTLLADGKVLLAAGSTDATFLNSAEVFNPANNSFSPVGSLSQARKSHTATLLQNNKVLITGGKTATGDSLLAQLMILTLLNFSNRLVDWETFPPHSAPDRPQQRPSAGGRPKGSDAVKNG